MKVSLYEVISILQLSLGTGTLILDIGTLRNSFNLFMIFYPSRIDRRAFINLEHLRVLDLRGNKISFISDEAFQNLPELEDMDMAYNQLKTFNFASLDQVSLNSWYSKSSFKTIPKNIFNHTYWRVFWTFEYFLGWHSCFLQAEHELQLSSSTGAKPDLHRTWNCGPCQRQGNFLP